MSSELTRPILDTGSVQKIIKHSKPIFMHDTQVT